MEANILSNTIKNILGTETKVDVSMVQKGNRTLTGVSIGNERIRPMVYMEHYEDLFRAKGYEAVAREIIKTLNEAEIPDFEIPQIASWEYVKNNLILCIAPAGTNDDIVTIPYLDLELFFRVNLDNANMKDGTYKVTELMLTEWNVTKEDLLDVATRTNIYVVKSMRDTLKEMMGDMFDDSLEIPPEQDQTVITTEDSRFGASALYNKELLKEIADKYKSDLYIIPSSIHELIALPINNAASKEDMDSMVKQVNETEASPEEVLADHAYIFHRDTMEIEW